MMPMRAPSDTEKEISRKSGAAPYRLDSPCALMIGGKWLDMLLEPGFVKNTSSRDGIRSLGKSAGPSRLRINGRALGTPVLT
jgi:hypothetical protein